MNFIGKTFGKGLIVVIPVVATVFLVFWLGSTIERWLEPAIRWLPVLPYFPGMGLVLALALIFVIGLLMRAPVSKHLVRAVESLIGRLPLIRALYGSLRDLMRLFAGDQKQLASRVVTVDFGDGRGTVLGFVTRENFDDLPAGIGGPDHVAVYLPMSYQLGGYTAILPRTAIQPVDLPIERAMRFALTAGVKTQSEEG